ncbi:hypothetical protein GIB67_017344 [Kingdonia uniflora]|uniref:DUF4005 domain-containing protein n=1 Tax=Kingdonia uniflora TaxID=39325 RepID=A0A7J7LAZ6_9MAGN|nr:hypothetical protein GIB67_017344 [Kingdonia uniflora]
MLMDKDLDNDAVVIEYGADGNDHVRSTMTTSTRLTLEFQHPLGGLLSGKGWFRALLGGKKNSASLTDASDSKTKKQLNFVRSFRDKDNNTPIVSAQTESSMCHYIDHSIKHTIVIAATTVAVAEAVVKVAHMAPVVVKLTGGSGRCLTIRVDWAAIRIQAAFRGYLAKKALWALKGLVKLQALVRGHIVRKKITNNMRAMQVFVRVQARARARASSRSIMEAHHHINKPSMSHPGPPTPEKYERTRCFNSTSHNRFSNLKRSAGRRCSPPPPESSSDNSCILKDMFGTNVAYETLLFNTTAPKGFYSVIIDEVIHEEVCLYVESCTLGDVSVGEVVAWLKNFYHYPVKSFFVFFF